MKPDEWKNSKVLGSSSTILNTSFVEKSVEEKSLYLLFELLDPKYKDLVSSMFKFYYFEDIAEGIFEVYRILPIEFKSKLDLSLEQEKPNIEWYKKHRHKILWLDEKLMTFPAPKYNRNFSKAFHNTSDKVINEILVNERGYFERLQHMATIYAAELEAISQGKLGKEAAERLRLSTRQVEYFFGQTLQNVCRAAEEYVTKLDILVLIKAIPKNATGRSGIVAEILMEMSDKFRKAYGPYNARYLVAQKFIEMKSKEVAAAKQKHKPIAGQIKLLNFKELWQEMVSTKPEILDNKSIDAVLNSPVKTFTNYGVYTDKLCSELSKENNEHALEMMRKCHLEVKAMLNDVDAFVSDHDHTEQKMLKGILRR